jgi:predicted acetyltransferase
MREQHYAISALFPATTALYRSLGWEVAGRWGWYDVPARSLHAVRGDAAAARPLTPDDLPAIDGCYAAVAAETSGLLDRGARGMRGHRLRRRFAEFHVYGVESTPAAATPSGLDGYVVYRLTGDAEPHGVTVEELVARTATGARTLLRLVGSSGTVAPTVRLKLGPDDAVRYLLTQQDSTPGEELGWMLRLIDVVGAVAARGWPRDVRVAVDLDVHDPLIASNAGRWRLVVDDGVGQLERGGSGTVALGIGALSALYAGGVRTATLRRAGLLRCDGDRALTALDAATAGPSPYLLDYF